MGPERRILPITETIAPADEAAVATAVRDACRVKAAVYPIGGGTRLTYGARPSRRGIGLSTANMRRVVDYPAGDLTITAEAGMTLDELGDLLAKQRQWLPIDVPQGDRATLGGVLATNTCGPRRYAYGSVRDYVLGIRAIDGSGEAFAGGAHVVKNAAGYNIPRLLVGSLGTLAVITQATLMVRPLPEMSALMACDLPDFETAENLLAGLSRTQTLPVAIELLAGRWRFFNRALPIMREGAVVRLIVGFDGGSAEVEWMMARLADEWRAAEVEPVACVSGGDADGWWGSLAGFPAEVQINVLPGTTVAVLEKLLELAPHCAMQAHAGNGIIEAHLSSSWSSRVSAPVSPGEGMESPRSATGADPFAVLLREKIRPAVAAVGGKVVVVAPPDDAVLDTAAIWGPQVNGAALGRALKDRFDPQNILNPGRFVFSE